MNLFLGAATERHQQGTIGAQAFKAPYDPVYRDFLTDTGGSFQPGLPDRRKAPALIPYFQPIPKA